MLGDRFPQLLTVLLTCGWLAGCASPVDRETQEVSSTEAEAVLDLPGLLIGASWLSARLDDPRLVVLDARPPEDYQGGHIPRSVSLPTTITFEVDRSNKLPPVAKVEKLLSIAGIDAGKTVVVYDQDNLRDAARLLWLLEVHGHSRVAVLNGGYTRWLTNDLPASTTPRQPTPATFIANVSPEHLASLLQTRQAIDDPGTIIVDVRSPDEYNGQEDQWPRRGHIPSAINIDWHRNLRDEEGIATLRDPKDLRALYPYEPGTRFITYCSRGARAAVSYLAIRLAGFEAAVYDGSWDEWAVHPEVPIAPMESSDRQPMEEHHEPRSLE